MMRRRISRRGPVAIAAIAATALTIAAALTLTAGAVAQPAAHPARVATVRIMHTSSGALLVASNGHTIYQLSRDRHNHDVCVTTSGCASVWPPLTVSGKPTAGSGAKASLLGTISLGHGHRQVTYGGHPLYTYSGDTGPAQTAYLGANTPFGTWYGVSASGKRVG